MGHRLRAFQINNVAGENKHRPNPSPEGAIRGVRFRNSPHGSLDGRSAVFDILENLPRTRVGAARAPFGAPLARPLRHNFAEQAAEAPRKPTPELAHPRNRAVVTRDTRPQVSAPGTMRQCAPLRSIWGRGILQRPPSGPSLVKTMLVFMVCKGSSTTVLHTSDKCLATKPNA